MKIENRKMVKISALEIPEVGVSFPPSAVATQAVREALKQAGFDLDKPIETYRGINSFYYLFLQEL